MGDDRGAIETTIQEAFNAQAFERAATLAIEHYGPELLGFVSHLLRDPDAGAEAFAEFSEVFWRSLPSFEWRCSMRTWVYKLARRTAIQHQRRERRQQHAAITRPSQLTAAIDRVRTATAAHLRTDVKDRFQALRGKLSSEDQTLLILRVDRGLNWRELAEVLLESHEDRPTDKQLVTEAARLRKRYQLAKARVRELLEQEGLL